MAKKDESELSAQGWRSLRDGLSAYLDKSKLKRNAIRCLSCDDIIESKSVHDCRSCRPSTLERTSMIKPDKREYSIRHNGRRLCGAYVDADGSMPRIWVSSTDKTLTFEEAEALAARILEIVATERALLEVSRYENG